MIVTTRSQDALRRRSLLTLTLSVCALLAWNAAAQADVLVVKNDNVGINVANPLYPLHIVEDTGVAGAADILLRLENNGPPRFDQTDTNANVTFRQSVGLAGTKRFYRVIDIADGTVELELTGDGNLIISGALTTAGGSYPDYVFADSYPLLPLSELASFIAEHGHLPNVPTAADSDGGKSVNMTELQLRLLEKVEELTLYTLQQEEKLVRQQGLIDRQQSAIETLRQRLGDLEERR
jgi:hypothetical protein